jgi:NAD(P)-dependent dehydrogenase (short-subunit alcohol dehydrogenase family)
MKTILITGGNRGIGLELARQLTARGDRVIAAVRKPGAELPQTGARIIANIDVGDADGVARLARELGQQPLDWLINNAGILEHDTLDDLDFESAERQFRVNSLGPLRVTAALRGNLGSGSRVFVLSSTMGSIADNSSGSYYGYRMSKAAVNMAARSLSVDLRDDGIAVFPLHPGYVATDMTRRQGPVAPADAARGLITLMDSLPQESSGTFWHARGHPLPW